MYEQYHYRLIAFLILVHYYCHCYYYFYCKIKFILKNLGGIYQIVELCLTSPDHKTKNILQENVSNLANLVKKYKNSKFENQDSLLFSHKEPTLNEFNTQKIIFAVNATNNLYFKYLPFNIASYIYYNILLNKKFVQITALVTVLLMTPSIIISITTDPTEKPIKTVDIYIHGLSYVFQYYTY